MIETVAGDRAPSVKGLRAGDSKRRATSFYGRRLAYRASTGAVLVITVPSEPGLSPYEGSDAAESFAA